MFSLLTNFLRLWTNIVTVQAVIFAEAYSGTDSFFLFLFTFAIVCTGIVQFKSQLVVQSLTMFEDPYEQRAWANKWELFALIFTLLSSLWLERIYMSLPLLFLVMGCQFIPQIIKNTIHGYRGVPDLGYAALSLLFCLYLPIYMHGIEGNILFLRPHPAFVYLTLTAAVLQLAILKIQQTRPRFLIPRKYREALMARRLGAVHQYEQDFEEEACRSSSSYLSNSSFQQEMQSYGPDARLNPDFEQELRRRRSQSRLKRMQAEECTICMVPMSLNRDDQQRTERTFFKTPCGHHFHRQCLLEWMQQKHQCPVCRTTLPHFEDPESY